jgi:hypothetical protein
MKTPPENDEELVQLKEEEDYYVNAQGFMVLTEKYLKKRGYCCENGCMHCPYGYRT